jgi:hypothetical protein
LTNEADFKEKRDNIRHIWKKNHVASLLLILVCIDMLLCGYRQPLRPCLPRSPFKSSSKYFAGSGERKEIYDLIQRT